jgi:hypothetical protein
VRAIAVRVIAGLLVANGLGGIVAVWLGWSATTSLLDGLRQTSATAETQQVRLVASVRAVATAVDDTAQATTGLSQSTTRARDAAVDAARTSGDLAATFDRLSQATRVTVFGVRPLEGLTQPFVGNADDFRRLSASLAASADSLADNARDVARVSEDLRTINGQVNAAANEVAGLRSAALIQQTLAGLELASRLFLGLILFEALLSALTGMALLMLTWHTPAHRRTRPAHLDVDGDVERANGAEYGGDARTVGPPPRAQASGV